MEYPRQRDNLQSFPQIAANKHFSRVYLLAPFLQTPITISLSLFTPHLFKPHKPHLYEYHNITSTTYKHKNEPSHSSHAPPPPHLRPRNTSLNPSNPQSPKHRSYRQYPRHPSPPRLHLCDPECSSFSHLCCSGLGFYRSTFFEFWFGVGFWVWFGYYYTSCFELGGWKFEFCGECDRD